ncbi:MAG: hypothetical protein AAB962_00315 [Patescibacteria group bacterium]
MGAFSVQSFLFDFLGVVMNAIYLWLPAITIFSAWKFWLYYIRLRNIENINWVLLEIKLPREITKSPGAMEMILNTIHQTRDGSAVLKLWEGFQRVWFSLEIASFGGMIHFYIYTQKGFKSLVEHQIYAQYPGIEIEEVEDYTKNIFTHNDVDKFYSAEFALEKEDAYPIKTYIDYGLDKLQNEEEQKNDPMTSLLEFMGSLKKSEQVWFQIMIRATKSKKWKESGKALVDKIMKRDKEKDSAEMVNFASLAISPGERLQVEAIERNISKIGFDVCIRTAYFAGKDDYRGAARGILTGLMKQYNSTNLNGFKLINATSYVDYFFPETRHNWRKKRMFDAYVKRGAFYAPFTRKLFVLNTEELATIYHFPGSVAKTPTISRIESKKGEPPTALPI